MKLRFAFRGRNREPGNLSRDEFLNSTKALLTHKGRDLCRWRIQSAKLVDLKVENEVEMSRGSEGEKLQALTRKNMV
jgi:hypothetical protein